MRDLPLNGLRVLAAIFETGGVRAAGRMLGITPSVAHRHLRELEARLGTVLVEPGRPRVEFTPAGDRLGRVASQALGELTVGVDSAREDRRSNHVVIATTESFATTWLLPRMVRFYRDHPTFVISIRTDQRPAIVPRDADLAIRLGAHADSAGAVVEPLMSDVMVPVLSPQLAASIAAPSTPESTIHFPRLHDRDAQTSWQRWGAAFDFNDPRLREGARLTSSALVMAAAAGGLGIALARRRLAEGEIAAGRLVELSEFAVALGTAYWLVRRPSPRSAEHYVIDWIRRESVNR